jgi:hypothetical protein
MKRQINKQQTQCLLTRTTVYFLLRILCFIRKSSLLHSTRKWPVQCTTTYMEHLNQQIHISNHLNSHTVQTAEIHCQFLCSEGCHKPRAKWVSITKVCVLVPKPKCTSLSRKPCKKKKKKGSITHLLQVAMSVTLLQTHYSIDVHSPLQLCSQPAVAESRWWCCNLVIIARTHAGYSKTLLSARVLKKKTRNSWSNYFNTPTY